MFYCKPFRSFVYIALSLLGLGVTPVASADLYTIVDLGTLGGSNSVGRGINNLGQVTGESHTEGNTAAYAFLYSNGVMTNLGTLGGNSFGYGINASGQVTGFSHTTEGVPHAFLFSNGVMTDLGTLGGIESYGYGINASSQVMGSLTPVGGGYRAFLYIYNNGVTTDLGTLGGNSSASGINASGQVTGYSYTVDGEVHAFLYSNGIMTDLGTLGGNYSVAWGINDSGQVTGEARTADNPGIQHAFLYSGGAMTDLGTLGDSINGSGGSSINAFGQVVGSSQTINHEQHAFLYSGGVMTDLNSLLPPGSGWVLKNALGINDLGQITGEGYINGSNSITHAFLMTPVSEPGPDRDDDGILDADDACPNSDLSAIVVIDGCDSGVTNTVFSSGCTISDLIAACAEGASSHGQFVSCVSHVTNDLKKAGTITGQQKGAIQSCAAQADIP